MAVLYRHIRLDKNEPFYVGIGKTEERAYSIKSRNKHWQHIVNSSDYEVNVLFENLTWEQACKKEKEFIRLYGRKDLGLGTLVNLTDGGDGALGRPMTVKLKEKLAKSPNKFNLATWQKEHGAANKGKKLPSPSVETVKKRKHSLSLYWKNADKVQKDLQTSNFRENNPSYKLQICNHCQKEIQGASAFKRFHGNNCKLKQN
jgi:hypothetical protein